MKLSILLAGLALAFLLAFAAKVLAAPESSRLMGDDRYKTAVAVSQAGWPQGADTVVLTTGENFPDALSAAPLANKNNAPILLTGSGELNSSSAAELKRLKAKKVIIVGGSGVIPGTTENTLALMGIASTRLAGADRYETAIKVAQEVGVSQGIFVTTGLDFSDALFIAPIAAAAGMPILLSPQDDLTPALKNFISGHELPQVIIVNGDGELNDYVVSRFSNAEVIGGSDKFDRNVKLVNRFRDKLDLSTVYAATGRDYPDALAASILAAHDKAPLLLLDGSAIPSQIRALLGGSLVSTIKVLGGYGVIDGNTEATLRSLPVQINSVAAISDSVTEKQKYDPPKTVTVTLSNGKTQEVPVIWNLSAVTSYQAGIYVFQGTVKGYNGMASLTLTVRPVPVKVDNLSAEITQNSFYSLPPTVTVSMSDNSVQDFPVVWTSNLVSMSKTGTYTFQGTVTGTSLKATLTLKVSADAKVTIADPNLEWLIRSSIGKTDYSETIYKSDVLQISSLNAAGRGISDLTGLESFTNLAYFDLGSNALASSALAPLSKLAKLKTLKLNANQLSDIKALQGLTTLTYLDVHNNVITDFTPLKGLTRLTSLYLSGNASTDYSPLRAFYGNLWAKDFNM